MRNFLDIDMDFFLDKIAHWIIGNDRLSDDEYKPWSENEFRSFLENRCLLSRTNLVKGRVITNHHEAFFFWDELINFKNINVPFKVTHIDAHSDTGLGDGGYVYIMGELIHHPISERRKILNTNKVYNGNYLAYALACGWINEVEFVLHERWENDIFKAHLKNFTDAEGKFQLKGYPPYIDIGMSYDKIIDGTIPPNTLDNEIPYTLMPWKRYQAKEKFDYVLFCQSPDYTPKKSDCILDIVKEYMIEI